MKSDKVKDKTELLWWRGRRVEVKNPTFSSSFFVVAQRMSSGRREN
jgi:hypothetical protein